ncbi:12536_t:CDS:2 [Funneliformis mosseae]|uniref:12536_t:CDS:1 n=1 Tax=Funneliformis mosseae TaxID=27381 RepID=A0A9N8YTA1_FUNMO|nr:12536_t:CDS:2 [Funneliformis mosseae]
MNYNDGNNILEEEVDTVEVNDTLKENNIFDDFFEEKDDKFDSFFEGEDDKFKDLKKI